MLNYGLGLSGYTFIVSRDLSGLQNKDLTQSVDTVMFLNFRIDRPGQTV